MWDEMRLRMWDEMWDEIDRAGEEQLVIQPNNQNQKQKQKQ